MNQAAILLWVSSAIAGQRAANVGHEPTPDSSPATEQQSVVPTFAYTTQPPPRQRATLNAWAESRQLSLVPPRSPTRSQLRGYDAGVVRRIEHLLEQARLSAGALDEALALEQLDAAESMIYSHAELPQAAYLLAEAASQKANLVERRGLFRLAEIHRSRARALEGPRAKPYTAAAQAHTRAPPGGVVDEAIQQIQVQGLASSDLLKWDGSLQRSRNFVTSVGEHHAHVLREGELAWAGFVMVHRAVKTLNLKLDSPAPCTRADFSPVRLEYNRVVAGESVRCPLWVVARPSESSAEVEVALCRYAQCGPLLTWRQGLGQQFTSPLHGAHSFELPAWAIYLTASVGTAAAATLLLWQVGAFEEADTRPPTWTFGGVSR